MNIEIDQSGKIENTEKNTVIAFSNHENGSIFISAKDKREIQSVFRRIGKPKIFVYKTFAVLIFLLLKSKLNKISEIIIDREYIGQEDLIKNYLLRTIRKILPDFSARKIYFCRIGKKSKAHTKAYLTFVGKMKPDKTINADELIKMLFK